MEYKTKEMIPLEKREVRGITISTAFAFFFGWSSIIGTFALGYANLKEGLRDNARERAADKTVRDYEIQALRQTLDLHQIEINDIKRKQEEQAATVNNKKIQGL